MMDTTPHGTTEQATEQATPNVTEVHECALCWQPIAPDEPRITGEDIGCACKQSCWHLHCLHDIARKNFFKKSPHCPYTCPFCRTSISKRLMCGEGKFANGDPTLRCLYGRNKPQQAPATTLPVWVTQLTKGAELKMRPLHFNKFCKAPNNNGTDIANVFRMVKDKATHTGFLTVRHVNGGAVIRRKYNAFSGLITSV